MLNDVFLGCLALKLVLILSDSRFLHYLCHRNKLEYKSAASLLCAVTLIH